MWKLIALFNFFLVFLVGGEELQEQLTLRVKVKDIIKVEKPPFIPPDKLSYRVRTPGEVNLVGKLLEPPKEMEEAELYVPREGGCGAPKDLNLYKEAVLAYRKGNLFRAEEKLKTLITLQGSPYADAGKYLLGLVYYKRAKKEDALKLFEEACNTPNMYTSAACESFFALYYELYEKPYRTEEPLLWRVVYLIGAENTIPEEELDCSRYTFKEYCSYVNDFIKGRINIKYRASTEVRRAILLYEEGRHKLAKKILEKYKHKLLPYRDVVLYYLALIEIKEGNYEKALDYALLLETINEELAGNLYQLIALKNPELSDYAYEKTGEKWLLKYAGVKAYNEGDYKRALAYFERAGDYLYATYAALKLGDYEKAYELLKKVQERDERYYRLLLEVLYTLGREEEFLRTLEEVWDRYPKLYKEFYGWYLFKKGKWEEAEKYFENPYYKAVALFNAGKYEEVLRILKEDSGYHARILKAKAAIALGKGELARKFLYNETSEEIYLTGLSYFIDGEYEKAIKYFEKLLKDEEYGLRALLKTADSYYNMGQKEKAKTLYNVIIQKFMNTPEAREALIALAQIEVEEPTKDLEKLVEEFARTFPDSPLIPELYLQLARVYASEGRLLEAEALLRKVANNPDFRERALLELARITTNKREKEKILLNLINSEDEAVRKAAFLELVDFYQKQGKLLKLARLLEKRGPKEQIRAVEIYLQLGRKRDAERLFNKLYRKYPQDEELKEIALRLYEATKKLKYLKIAYKSKKPEVALRAAYLLGNYYRGKDDRKAIEYFLEVVLDKDARNMPFYKKALFASVDLLIKLKAKRDAACMLRRLEELPLEPWEREKVLKLKETLPPCEV